MLLARYRSPSGNILEKERVDRVEWNAVLWLAIRVYKLYYVEVSKASSRLPLMSLAFAATSE